MAEFLFRSASTPATATGYSISRSLRFNSADSPSLTRTPGSAGNRKTYTWSGWVKRASLGSVQWLFGVGPVSTDYMYLRFTASDTLEWGRVVSSSVNGNKITSQVFRDTSAWYHIVCAIDAATTSAKLYVNGVEITAFGTNSNPANVNGPENNTVIHSLGRYADTNTQHLNGYMAEVHFVDGTALTPSSFGETDAITGQWIPKQVTGVTYGTNGFYLPFSDNTNTTTLGYDSAGSNDWTLNNFSVTAGVGNDSLTDTPTNNHCTLQQLNNDGGTLSNGGLRFIGPASHRIARGTFLIPSSGKWAFRCRVTSAPFSPRGATSAYSRFGVVAASVLTIGGTLDTVRGSGLLLGDGGYINNFATGNGTDSGATIASGDAIDLELDRDANTFAFTRSGVTLSSGTINTTAGADLVPVVVSYDGSYAILEVDFGQNSYTPPSGYSTLCTSNLPTPSIVKPSNYFDVETYTGTGATRSKTGLGFQPDLVWFKGRSGATDHALYDAVRGVQKQIESNTTTAETTETTGLTAFNSDGYTTGALAQLNTNAATYAAWLWKEGITPGFDIVSYTGNGSNRTISHSLGVAPKLMLVKDLTGGSNTWRVYHGSIANTNYLELDTTIASASGTAVWNSTSPTSSVFSLGTSVAVNNSGSNYIAYLFAEVAGFSRFGSYTGNGNADGPFVHCGFRPKFVMVKRADTLADWAMFDVARSANVNGLRLIPNSPAAEDNVATYFDFLSNGFKSRTSATSGNASGGTYIFAAFAEFPFKYSNAR